MWAIKPGAGRAARMRNRVAAFGPWTIVLAVCVVVGGLSGTAAAARGAAAGGAGASGTGTTGAGASGAAAGGRWHSAAASLSKIRHVWIIELENAGYDQSFGTPSRDPELAKVLTGEGALLKRYYGIGHDSLDNYVFTG